MKNYRTKDLSINDIKVDQKNPRFQEVHSQKDAINTMVEKQGKKLIAMADHISNHGLDPSKLVVVFKENGDYVCGEGNRRVTTLKCIHDLSLVSNARTRKLFGKFSKTSFPSKIPCVICKDRDEANVWIALNHNGPGTEKVRSRGGQQSVIVSIKLSLSEPRFWTGLSTTAKNKASTTKPLWIDSLSSLRSKKRWVSWWTKRALLIFLKSIAPTRGRLHGLWKVFLSEKCIPRTTPRTFTTRTSQPLQKKRKPPLRLGKL